MIECLCVVFMIIVMLLLDEIAETLRKRQNIILTLATPEPTGAIIDNATGDVVEPVKG